MNVHRRPYQGEHDRRALAELVRRCPEGTLHVVDLPWRLSSWAFDFPDNVGIWEDERGQVVAWAVLQTPFWTVDYALAPSAYAAGFLPEMLAWADSRARNVRDQPGGHPCWFVQVRAGEQAQVDELVRAGYQSVAEAGANSWSGFYFVRDGRLPVPQTPLPGGFVLRPLAGDDEVAAYVALHRAAFGSENMTAAWRARTLRDSAYDPGLDLVVEGPDGRLVAFCVCWVAADHATDRLLGQIEPTGVQPDYRQKGLGRAVLLEGVRRMRARGVEAVIVETDDSWEAAVSMYQAQGFVLQERIVILRKDVGNLG